MIGTSDMPPYLQVLRPHQWVKNLLVLIPLFFTERAFELAGWLAALTALGSFCFAASSIYLLNDILDRHEDALARLHLLQRSAAAVDRAHASAPTLGPPPRSASRPPQGGAGGA